MKPLNLCLAFNMLLTIIFLGVFSTVAVLFLKRFAPEYAMVVSIAAGVVILLILLVDLGSIFDAVEQLFISSGLNGEVFKLTLKALGLCYITNFAVDVCKDFGQTSLASKIELAGKIAVITLSFPLIETILKTVTELIG